MVRVKNVFLGGAKFIKSRKILKPYSPRPSEGGDSDDTFCLKWDSPNSRSTHRCWLRASLGALGGPILGFAGVGWVPTSIIAQKKREPRVASNTSTQDQPKKSASLWSCRKTCLREGKRLRPVKVLLQMLHKLAGSRRAHTNRLASAE